MRSFVDVVPDVVSIETTVETETGTEAGEEAIAAADEVADLALGHNIAKAMRLILTHMAWFIMKSATVSIRSKSTRMCCT